MSLSRRQFLKLTGAMTVAGAAASMIPAAVAEAPVAGLPMTAPEDVISEAVVVNELPEAPAMWRDAVNKADPFRTIFPGAYRVPVTVAEGDEREALVYIGADFNMCQGIIFVVPQSGTSAVDCLVGNGWKKLADENGNVIMILQPGEAAYDLGEGSTDLAFLKAMVARGGTRSHWFMPKGRAYIAGYGDGATLVAQYIPSSIKNWAGVGLFGNPAVDPAALGLKAEVPCWIYTDSLEASAPMVELLKKVNGCSDEMLSSPVADQIWAPAYKTTRLLLNDQPIAQVRVSLVGDPGATNATRTAAVYDFFCKYTRETGYGAKAIRYAMEVEDWGATRQTVEVDGVTRSWIEYIPKTARNTVENGCPLMLVLHGNALNGEYFVERSQYIRMAEDKGFALAFPNGSIGTAMAPTWNLARNPEQWNDVAFIRAMIEDIKSRNAIDASRIYCYGHSMGGMTTQMLASSELAGVFAAAAGTGCAMDLSSYYGEDYQISDIITPFHVVMGEFDQWDASMGTDAANWCIDFWKKAEKIDGEPTSYRDGRFRTYEWTNADGVNTFSYVLADGLPHTTTLDIGLVQYAWMSRFSRNEDGTLAVNDGFYEAPKA